MRARSLAWLERPTDNREVRSSNLRGPIQQISTSNAESDFPAAQQDSKQFVSESDDRFERQQFKKQLLALLPKLPKHEVEELRSTIHQHYIKHFRRSHVPKYGSVSRGFSEQELQAFFRAIDNEKFRLLFEYQAELGLRIGEAIRVNLSSMNFKTRELRLKTEKSRIIDTLLVPVPLFQRTVEFVKHHLAEIERAQGYIFFKDASSHKPAGFLEEDYVRGRFRYYAALAGLDEVYDISEESQPARKPRRLHRLTTHSLRHYAITKFSKSTNGNVVLTSRFARHANPSTTMAYISTSKQELYKEIDSAFSLSQIEALKAKISRNLI